MPLVAGREVVQVIEGSVFHLLRDDQGSGLRELAIPGSVLELGPFPKREPCGTCGRSGSGFSYVV